MAGKPDELVIDELARTIGMTVRNVRAYAARGLLSPPRLVGRTGYYNAEHIEQLSLVRDLLSEGLTLAAVERVMGESTRSAGLALDMLRTVRDPWLPEVEEEIDDAELADRTGVAPDPELLERWVADGVVELLPGGRVRLLQPDLLEACRKVVALGVPAQAVVDMQPLISEHARAVSKLFVDLIATTVWRDFIAGEMPAGEWERIRETIAALIPISGQALLASFRAAMRQQIDDVVPLVFSTLETA